MADMILDVDYNITAAEAKQQKLDREFELSQQKAKNIKKEIKETSQNIADSIKKQKQFNKELDLSAQKLDEYNNGNANFTREQYQQELKRNAEIQKKIEKEESYQHSQEKSLAKQKLQLETQNAKTADIGNKIVQNTKKQNKFTQAFAKSTKSADRFGRRLKSLIASALFFSVVTKAFTALRNEFGKLITETGSKTAYLISQINSNLSTIGRTLYEGAKPYIEWLLEKVWHITYLFSELLAKALGKDITQMRKLATTTKKTAENAQKATAGFDTLQKIDTKSQSESDEGNSASNNVPGAPSKDDLEKTKKGILDLIPPIAAIITLLTTGKIVKFLSNLGFVPTWLTKIISGVGLLVSGFILLVKAALDWDDAAKDGGNTFNAILGTLGTILAVIGLIILGVSTWPVLIVGAFLALGIWIDNFKNSVFEWIDELPAGLYDILHWFTNTAHGIWNTIKNLIIAGKELLEGDWKAALKRIGVTIVNALVYMVNALIDGINLMLYPLRALVAGIAKLSGQKWSIRDVAIPHVPTMKYPALATGAVLPGGSPMLAWVNDQPKGQPYVEGSIDNIAAAFEKYLGGRPSGNQKLVVEAKGNWAQFIKWLNLQIKQEDNRASIWGG